MSKSENWNWQDVRNLIKRINENEMDNPKAEDILGKMLEAEAPTPRIVITLWMCSGSKLLIWLTC